MRRLSYESLEERRLLSFIVPSWMNQSNVSYTRTDSGDGSTFEVFIQDLSKDWVTPSTWQWKPSCFDASRGPIVDLSDLHTGFQLGTSFTIYRPNVGMPRVYNTAYELRAEILDDTPAFDDYAFEIELPAASSYGASATYEHLGVSIDHTIAFNPSFDRDLNVTGLQSSITISGSMTSELFSKLSPKFPVGYPPVGAIYVGVGGSYTAGLTVQVVPEFSNGAFRVAQASITPTISIGVEGFGELSLLEGYAGKGGVSIAGTVTQNLIASCTSGAWTYSAPGSVNLTGTLYASVFGGLAKWEHEAFSWDIGSWDFLKSSSPPPPPVAHTTYAPPSVTITGGLSTEASRPTVKGQEYLVVTATATSPAGISANAIECTTWKKAGSEWISKVSVAERNAGGWVVLGIA